MMNLWNYLHQSNDWKCK